MKDIIKYSSILFFLALSSSYIASCFAIDLKILNYQERQIGLSLSFFGLGVILAVLFHNYIREKINIFVSLIFATFAQSILSCYLLFDVQLFIVASIMLLFGFTNGLNVMTLETHISSNFKKNAGFYIALFWSSAGLGAITGTLIIAINGINELTYKIGLILIIFQFIPIMFSRYNLKIIAIHRVSFHLSFEVITKLKYLLFCVFLLGICDAGFSALYPSYLLENAFIDKEIGRINFFAGSLVLLVYPFMGKIIDRYNKIIIFNFLCLFNLVGLFFINFTYNFYLIILYTGIYYFTVGSVFLICFNIIGLRLEKNLVVFGVGGYTFSENIGSFFGPNAIGNITNINIDYFFKIFFIIFLLIILLFNLSQIKENVESSKT